MDPWPAKRSLLADKREFIHNVQIYGDTCVMALKNVYGLQRDEWTSIRTRTHGGSRKANRSSRYIVISNLGRSGYEDNWGIFITVKEPVAG